MQDIGRSISTAGGNVPDRQHRWIQDAGEGSELMLAEPVGELPVVDDARWSSGLTDNLLIAGIWWIAIMVLLFVVGLPWARLTFSTFPDHGAGFARLIALLTAAYVVWILASLEMIRFQAMWGGLSLLVIGGSGWIALRRSRESRWSADLNQIVLAPPELAFWSVFALFLLLRLANPDSWHHTWGGEKPMEFAHINALLRSAHFPPYDPWFSGGILNYYYYGEYLVAYLMKLSGIPSEVAFNLAQPTVMAMLASGVYSVSTALGSRLSTAGTRAWIAGFTGVVIVVLMGNLVALRNVIKALPSVPEPNFIEWTWAGSRAISGGITEFPYFTGLYADLHAHVVALPVTVLVIGLGLNLALSGGPQAIDSSKYVAVLPFALCALSLGTLGAANAWDVPLYGALIAASVLMYFQAGRSLPGAAVASLLVLSLVAGAAWLLFKPFHDEFVAIFNSVDRVRSGTEMSEYLWHLGGVLSLIAIGLVAYPGVRRFAEARGPERVTLQMLLFAACTAVAAIMAIVKVDTLDSAPSTFAIAVMFAFVPAAMVILLRYELGLAAWTALVAVAMLTLALAIISYRGWDVLALSLAVGAIGAFIWIDHNQPVFRYMGLLIAAGGFAAAGVEVVYVVDDLQTLEDWYRMNTLFKVYNEVWIVLGLASAGLVGTIFTDAANRRSAKSDAPESDEPTEFDSSPRSTASNLTHAGLLVGMAAIVIAAGLLYPALATQPRLEQRFPGHPAPSTLNALDWMDYGTVESATGVPIAFDEDRDVINWFNEHVEGTPVIAEASIGPYRGNGSRISIATGLPTIIGWARHERQQRYNPEIDARLRDLSELYNTTSVERKLEILRQYDVEYIVVGDVERKSSRESDARRLFASGEGLTTFESMVGTHLEVAFVAGSTVVYRVIEEFAPD